MESFLLRLNDSFIIIPKVLQFDLVYNRGAAYGIFQNQQFFLIIVSLIIMTVLVINWKKIASTKYAWLGSISLMAGALGNFTDRLFRGKVVDFFNIHIIPVFNVADILINIAIIAYLIDIFLIKTDDETAST